MYFHLQHTKAKKRHSAEKLCTNDTHTSSKQQSRNKWQPCARAALAKIGTRIKIQMLHSLHMQNGRKSLGTRKQHTADQATLKLNLQARNAN